MDTNQSDLREDQVVLGAFNVRYILRCARLLTLLINLDVDTLRIAKSDNARIEDLPIRMSVHVIRYARTSKDKMRIALEPLHTLERLGPRATWIVDETLLRITIDLADAPELSRKAEAGAWSTLASLKAKKLGNLTINVSMRVECEGGGLWPVVSSSQSMNAISVETTPPRNVRRTLEFSSEQSVGRGSFSPATETGIIQFDDNVLLDIRHEPIVKLCLNITGKYGCVVSLTRNILDSIGVVLKVEFYGSAQTPIRFIPGTNKRVNAELYLEDTGDETLVLEFDISKNNGEIKERESLLISQAVKVNVGSRCVVDFLALRPLNEIPFFTDVYMSVCKLFEGQTNPLDSLQMPIVRKFVTHDLRQYEVTRELKNLIWEAVRWYAIECYLPAEESSSSIETPLHESY